MATTTQTPVTITCLRRASDAWWELSFRAAPDDFAHIVRAIKCIPAQRRSYDPTRRCWRIASTSLLLGLGVYLPGLKERVEHLLGGEEEEAEPRPAVSTLPPAVERAYVTLHLLPSAPRCVVKAAYRALAAETHPDVGGSTVAMQQLNAARDTLVGWLDTRGRRTRAA